MAIFKRFEIWLLFGLMAAAVWFAMKADPGGGIDEPLAATVEKPQTKGKSLAVSKPVEKKLETPEINEEEEPPPFQVKKVAVTRTEQGRVIDLTLLGRAHNRVESLDLNADKDAISVVTDTGEEVDRFFHPFAEPAVLDAKEDSLVNLKYWLKSDDAKLLWVSIGDHKFTAEIPKE